MSGSQTRMKITVVGAVCTAVLVPVAHKNFWRVFKVIPEGGYKAIRELLADHIVWKLLSRLKGVISKYSDCLTG